MRVKALHVALVGMALGVLVVLVVGYVDTQLPRYGFEAERASWEWRALMLVMQPLLPSLAAGLLFGTIIAAGWAFFTVNQPTNQPTQLPTQHAQLTDQRAQHIEVSQPTFWEEAPEVVELIEPLEPGDLSPALRRAVMTTADCEGDMKAAADLLGVGYEAVRKAVAQSRERYPDWTNWHVPPKGR
jgi:hypothetical protein